MSYFQKNIDQWHTVRWGKFTASRIEALMGAGKGTMFDKGALSYINEIACQELCLYEENLFEGTWEMREGRKREPQAFAFYKKVMLSSFSDLSSRFKFEYYGDGSPHFQPYPDAPDEAGSSADGMMYLITGDPYIGSEFKCPKRETHIERLIELRNWNGGHDSLHFWLKNYNANYYAQVQFNMMCWGVDQWHWCSYNEYMKNESDRMIIIPIPKDVKFCQQLKIRIMEAIRLKKEIVSSLDYD